MFKVLPFCFFLFTLLLGCEAKKKVSTDNEKQAVIENFFPVTQYLLGQLRELDSLPVTPLKTTALNGKRDSAWVNRADIRKFAQPFLVTVIDSALASTYFSENSFLDQDIKAFTFSYEPAKPLPANVLIKRWDVYIDAQSKKVTRIFIIKQVAGTPAQTQQLTWRSGYSCKITTITEGVAPTLKEEEMAWNFDK